MTCKDYIQMNTKSTTIHQSIINRDNDDLIGDAASTASDGFEARNSMYIQQSYLDEEIFCKTPPTIARTVIEQGPPMLSNKRHIFSLPKLDFDSFPKLEFNEIASTNVCSGEDHPRGYYMIPRLNSKRTRQFQLSARSHHFNDSYCKGVDRSFSPTTTQSFFHEKNAKRVNERQKIHEP